MIIAIPTIDGHLNSHFGHSEIFTFVQIDPSSKEILKTTEMKAPEHQHGVLPHWLKENNVSAVIAGNMGGGARQMLEAMSIKIISGAPEKCVDTLVKSYLAGTLSSEQSTCTCTCGH